MRATITLKEGKSYRWKGYTFGPNPTVLTDPDDIRELQSNGMLNVLVDEDKPPPAPLAKGKSEDKPKAEVKVESKPAPKPSPKPAAKPAPKKPGPKPKAKE